MISPRYIQESYPLSWLLFHFSLIYYPFNPHVVCISFSLKHHSLPIKLHIMVANKKSHDMLSWRIRIQIWSLFFPHLMVAFPPNPDLLSFPFHGWRAFSTELQGAMMGPIIFPSSSHIIYWGFCWKFCKPKHKPSINWDGFYHPWECQAHHKGGSFCEAMGFPH